MNITISRFREEELEQAVADLEERGFQLLKKGKQVNGSTKKVKNEVTHRMEQESSESVKYIAVLRGGRSK